jgi:hypothetical protein
MNENKCFETKKSKEKRRINHNWQQCKKELEKKKKTIEAV